MSFKIFILRWYLNCKLTLFLKFCFQHGVLEMYIKNHSLNIKNLPADGTNSVDDYQRSRNPSKVGLKKIEIKFGSKS